MLEDLKYALRRLGKNYFEVGAGLLAFLLGIGINATMFSIGQAILFRPVELAHADRLILFEQFQNGELSGIYSLPPADVRDFGKNLQSVEASAYLRWANMTITKDGEPEQLSVGQTSTNWMEVLGANLVMGRTFRTGEDRAGVPRVAILAHSLWQRRYGGDAKILGRKIRLDGEEYEVIGVLKETSRFPPQMKAFVPLVETPQYWESRKNFELMLAGRLKPGLTISAAQAEAATFYEELIRRYPDTHKGRRVLTANLIERVTGSNDLAAGYTRMMLFATAFVLLIACANVANLQLARITSRGRDYAIQSALGAGRWRIARQVLVESVLLSLLGAALGAFASQWLLGVLRTTLPAENWQYIPMWPYLSLDGRALGFAVGVSVLAGLVAGLVPALHSVRGDAQEALREGGRSMSSGRARHLFRNGLVAFQMVLAIVLLIGAGLMVRGSRAVLQRFDHKQPEQIATARIALPGLKYQDESRRRDFAVRLDAALKRIPGQSATALVNNVPMSDHTWTMPVVVEGKPEPEPSARPTVLNQYAGAGYFALLRIPLRQGRLIEASDQAGREDVCVVDELFAARLFPGENPLGHRVAPASDGPRKYCKIVGVVAPEYASAWDREPRATLYRSIYQATPGTFCATVRGSAGQIPVLLAAIRDAVREVDPDQPLSEAFSHRDLIDTSLAGLRMVSLLMMVVGGIALLLACVGVYSVMAYSVSERTGEIGMRMAMGAEPMDILRELSRQTALVCGIGLVLGLGAGYGVAQLFSGLIYGVSASDFWSLSSVSLLLTVVAALAMYIPARRAMRLDPLAALRHD